MWVLMTSLATLSEPSKAADWRLSFFMFFQSSSMTTSNTRYAQFNSLTVTGRIFNAEVVTNQNNGDQFLSVSVISTAMKDGADLVYTFTNNNGLMALYNKGLFCKGREVTITGHISNVSEVYTTKTGEVKLRQRPEVRLIGVSVPEGGLGRMPQDKQQINRPAAGTVVKVGTPKSDVTPAVDETPAYGENTPADANGAPLF